MRIPDQGIMPWSPESTTNRSTRTNIVWEGIALGIILERIAPKRKAQKTLPRIYGFCGGPGKDHHFSNFSQHGLGRNCLGDHFGKSEAKRKTLSGICGFVMVLARIMVSPTFPNMVWQGVVLGSILEKAKPREKLVRNLCKIDGRF